MKKIILLINTLLLVVAINATGFLGIHEYLETNFL